MPASNSTPDWIQSRVQTPRVSVKTVAPKFTSILWFWTFGTHYTEPMSPGGLEPHYYAKWK